MSHLAELALVFEDLDCLEAALKKLGFNTFRNHNLRFVGTTLTAEEEHEVFPLVGVLKDKREIGFRARELTESEIRGLNDLSEGVNLPASHKVYVPVIDFYYFKKSDIIGENLYKLQAAYYTELAKKVYGFSCRIKTTETEDSIIVEVNV